LKTKSLSLILKCLQAICLFSALTFPAAKAAIQVDIKTYGARCNGSDDSGAVQAAINAIPTSGGTVLISCQAGIGPSGIVLTNKSNVTVAGSVAGAGFKTLGVPNQGAQGFGPVMFLVQYCTNCVIRDLVIDDAMMGVDAIGFDRCNGTTAQNIAVSNVAYPANAGIVAVGNTGNSYIGNSVTNTTASPTDGTRGMWIGNTGSTQTEFNATISNNTLSNIAATGIAAHVISAMISNNTVTNTQGAGVKIVPPPGGGGQSTIQGNTLRGNLFHGIQIENADSPVIIKGNLIDANSISGIYASGGVWNNGQIIGNTITNNPQSAIYLYNGLNITISGNQMSGNGHGVLIEGDNGYTIQGVTISNNTISGGTAHGVTMWGRGGTISSVNVNSNSIFNNALYGLYVELISGNLTGISAWANCYANDKGGTIYDNRSQIPPVAPSSSCPPAGQPDTTAPTVAVTAPTNAQTINGIVTLTAAASDDTGVTGLQFLLNGAPLGSKLTGSPFTASWDTRTVANGQYQLAAVANDAAGNTATSVAISVTVSNPDVTPPTVAITAPAAGQSINGVVTVTANASDNIGVTGLQFMLNGAALGTKLSAAPYSISWDTRTVANGQYQLTATANDAAGNKTTSAVVSVTVSNPDITAPTVQMTSPAAGTVSGTVTCTASASDNVGVAGVQFVVDGVAYGYESTSAPYTMSWNTTGVANGSHTLSAIARDAAGNKTTSATVTVNVSNTVAPPPPAQATTVRINAGGPAYTDASGKVWAADSGFSGGYVYSPGATVTGTTTPVLYQTQRWHTAPLTYQFAVANGSYSVNLKFAELYFNAAGQRVFNATINGQTVLANFDIVAAAGGSKIAVDKSFPVTVTGGQITIQFAASVDNPAINAIEIVPATPKSTIRVNAGGAAYTDATGTVWSADTGSSAGYAYSTATAIANTTNQQVYQSLRWNPATLGYQFSVANGTYTVNLKFAELYFTKAGQRVFNIVINGQTVLTNFDIVSAAGGANRAIDKAFTVNVTNGQISIQMTSSVDDPQVNGIEIY
jgi:parallel beta-helix repeat protein